jgi:SAM-dependent methyltransferase
MGRQENEFMNGEGNCWYERNKDKPGNYTRNGVIADHIPEPSSILEIGCADGRYLSDLQNLYGCKCTGIDPSEEALTIGRKRYPDLSFICGTANLRLIVKYDLIIYGFCLYVCDRETLPTIVAIGDGALHDGGHLVIHDFDPDYPHKLPYKHAEGLFSYKQDYSKLWLANPAYSLVHKHVIEDGTAVWVLKKNIAAGWPLEQHHD